MALIDKISQDVVRIPLQADSKPEVIEELLQVLVDAGKISDKEDAYRALLEREAKGSTGLENGIAVPHSKTKAVSSLTVSLGISPEGVDFDALDGRPCKVFFLILAAPDQSGPHIEALAEIARLTRSAAFVRSLVSAESPDEVVDLFQE
jgi:fructose-specific phosphotransferase system IIA component